MLLLPKTTPEQRSRFYEDVESLLSPGFLTHLVTVAGVRLHLRSLGTGDLFLLRSRTAGATAREWRVWTVASAIWMINGRVILGQDDYVPFLAEYVSRMPNTVLGVLFSTVLGLWTRVADAIDDTEPFNYELGSRYKWKSFGSQIPSPGVSGAERLGLNTVQRIWTAFNEMEDSRRSDETAWEGFKLVASANAPKAVGKIDQKDSQRRKEEVELRERKLDDFYYIKIGVLKKGEGGAPTTLSSFRGHTKSVEDLEEEMRRWVSGDADHHDKVVEDYKNNIRLKREQDQQQMEAHRKALEEARAEQERAALESGFRPQPLITLTGEQLQRMLQERGGGLSRPGVAFIPKAPEAGRLYDKFVAEGVVQPGQLQVVDGKIVAPDANPEADMRTLNSMVRSRNPTFGSKG